MKTKRNLMQMCLLGAALVPFTSAAQTTVTAIATGVDHSLFLKSDGSLWVMGNNQYGQLGDGTTNTSFVPKQIVASGVTAIAAGGEHSLYLKNDGSLWVMGDNAFGQLGDGLTNNLLPASRIVTTNVTAVAAGDNHSLFIKNDGSLWAMGFNQYGQLGDGTTNTSFFAEQVLSSGVTAIAAGGDHSIFIKKHGNIGHVTTELWTMGYNMDGELGDGTTNNRSSPEMILSYTAPAVGSPVTSISAGFRHCLFFKSDGSLWGMGDNNAGDLGDGTTTARYSPVEIVTGNVTAIAAGGGSSLFAKNDGSLWGMGDDEGGQLGDGIFAGPPNYGTNQPEEIVINGVTEVSEGYLYSLFIRDGNLWGMGYNYAGQLGDGSTDLPLEAINVPELIVTGPPPAAGIGIYNHAPVVFFPATGVNYVVQMSTNLSSNVWVTVTNVIPFSGLEVPSAPGTAFFRLQSP